MYFPSANRERGVGALVGPVRVTGLAWGSVRLRVKTSLLVDVAWTSSRLAVKVISRPSGENWYWSCPPREKVERRDRRE